MAILDARKSLSISFLAISDRYATLFLFEIFDKMAAVGHFECSKFTLDHISGHFRSIQIFYFFLNFLQNGCRWPFWMSENHFWSHFATLFFFEFFDKMADVCGTLKCENAAICEKVAKCEKYSTLNVKIDAICEKITLNVKKWGSLNVSNISTLNVLKSTLYVQTLFWRYLWKSNFSARQISER